MNCNNRQAITLIELLISIVLLAMVIVGFMSIDTFSRHHLVSSDRRAKLQNEAMLILEHMTKQLIGVIGDSESEPINITAAGANSRRVRGFIDNGDGIRGLNDNWTDYCFGTNDCGAGSDTHTLSFQLVDNSTGTASPVAASRETLSRRVSAFRATMDYANSRNYFDVTVTTCWDPDGAPLACHTADNPAVTLNTTIRLPSVSIK
ncbi:MAG: prepilin-type N-terminal cleavage/methylation domain-containing protein [Candidatus Omnitrophica bacterium]|nr:prepilin-type N-terminal cleavage/methylation domain-containing protein [Candidatus Omnitrophota bacterium]